MSFPRPLLPILVAAILAGASAAAAGASAAGAGASAAAAAAASPARAAASPRARPAGPAAVVVYSDGFALVRQPVAFDAAAGASEVTLDGVPPRIDSTSVRLTGEGFSVRGQVYRYDLWSAGRVFERFLGDTISFRYAGRPYRGVLAGIDGDDLFIERRDSTQVLMMLKRMSVSEIEFPERLDLATRPSLAWRIQGERAGAKRGTLSYLTDGVRWNAEYAAVLDASGASLEWSGLATIVNRSGASFAGASVSLVAGDVHRAGEAVSRGDDVETPGAGAPPPAKAEFFTYHFYGVPDPLDLGPTATTQVPLVPATRVRAVRTYRYDGARDGSKVRAALEFTNDKKEGLGTPLPAGRVRVYAPDPSGVVTLAGEDQIPHTPAGERVRIQSGVAFDLVGERTRIAHTRVSRSVTEDQYRIRLRNRGGNAATVTVVENLYGNWEISERSAEFRKKDAENVEFDVGVGAGEESVLTFTVRYTY